LVAGLLTGIWQAYPTLSAKGLIEAARMSASYAYSPNNRWGYGIPSYQAIVNYLEHLENSSMVELYPNPTESEVVIKVNDPSVDYDVDLKLFNSEGKILNLSNLDITWQDNKYILDVSTLPRGIYVLNLQSNTRYSKLKFIKL